MGKCFFLARIKPKKKLRSFKLNGGSYINTGLNTYMSGWTYIELDVDIQEIPTDGYNKYLWGVINTSTRQQHFGIHFPNAAGVTSTSGNIGFDNYYTIQTTGTSTTNSPIILGRHTYRIGLKAVDINNYYISRDGIQFTLSGLNFAASQSAGPAYLFNTNKIGTGSPGSNFGTKGLLLYSAKIYHDSTLVRDYTPLMDGTNCVMYDAVSGTNFQFLGDQPEPIIK